MSAKFLNSEWAQSRQRAFRRRRFRLFADMISRVVAHEHCCRILDVGGESQYWGAVADMFGAKEVHVTLLNRVSHPVAGAKFEFVSVVGDARNMGSYPSMSFHIVHSNSVIEHVGRWQDMMAMAREVSRLAPSYFVQTPYFWFPVEPHCMTAFFHWLPEPLRVSMLLRRGRGHWQRATNMQMAMSQVESAVLLDRRMLAALFPDAAIHRERVFGVTKSLIAVRDAT